MAVTPLVANARLTINYASDLAHKMQILCVVPTTYGGNLTTLSLATLPTTTAVAHWASLVQPFFAASAALQTWVLEQFVGGAYVEIDAGSLGLAGTNVGATTPGTSWTWTFFDSHGKKVRHRHLGIASGGGVNKLGYAALTGVFKAYVDDLVPSGVAGKMGDWAFGRSAGGMSRFIAIVESFNRKSRRRLGVV